MWIPRFLRRKQETAMAAPVRATDADTNTEPCYGPGGKVAFDGIVNWMTGQGGANDPTTAAQWMMALTENWQTLMNVHRSSWLAKKIVDKKPADMLRAGWEPIWEGMGDRKGDEQTQADQLRQSAMRFKVDAKILEALKWARLFGGSVIVIGIKGQLLTDPLPIKDGAVDYSGIKKGGLAFLHVYDRWRAAHDGVMDENLMADDGSENPNCGRPEFHILSSDGGLMGQRVHWTRAVRFDGALVPWWTWRANGAWHDSILQVLVDSLKQYDSMTGAISALIPKARQDIVMAKGAAKDLADAEGTAALAARYAASARLASMYNLWIFDKDTEEYKQQTFSFAGLDKIWEKAMKEVAGSTGYPVSVLFGDEPSGLNATGDASQRNYYDDIAAARETELKPAHLVLLECVARHEFGELPPGFSIQYKPLWQASDVEKSTINLNRANADHIRLEDGVVSPATVARENKELNVYTTVTQDEVDQVAELEKAAQEQEEERANAMAAQGGQFGQKPAVPPQAKASKLLETEEKASQDARDLVLSANDCSADQPRKEAGTWGSGGGIIARTKSGKPIVSPEKVERFAGSHETLHTDASRGNLPRSVLGHVDSTSESYTKADHYEAHHALMAAAKAAQSRGDHDRAYHLGATASAHKIAAQRYGKNLPKAQGQA